MPHADQLNSCQPPQSMSICQSQVVSGNASFIQQCTDLSAMLKPGVSKDLHENTTLVIHILFLHRD